MSGIIKRSDYSYRITNEPETNEDGNIYVFNGIRLDNSGNKETVKILFVRRTLRFVDFQRYGSATKICKLPESFYDERFNKKYGMSLKNVEKAEENLRCANLGFAEGVMTATEVMEAQTAWLQAQTQKIDAEIDLRLSQIGMKKALGVLQ